MKKVLAAVAVMLIVLFTTSCGDRKEVVKNSVPKWTVEEWNFNLSSPVKSTAENAERLFLLPDEILQIFPEGSLEQSCYPANWIKLRNNLPGNAFDWCRNARYTFWPISQEVKRWDGTENPADYVYIIDYDRSLISMIFTDSVTIHCTRLERPDGTERPKSIKCPSGLAKYTWSFSGSPSNCKDLALGKIISYNSQYGYTEVTSWWRGGEYELPGVLTSIKVDGKTIYSD